MADTADHDSRPVPQQRPSNGSSITPAKPERVPSRKNLKNMNGPLYMQTKGTNNVVLVRRVRRKDEGSWRHLASWMVENQIGLSFNLIALLFLPDFLIPKAREHTRNFFVLSNFNPTSGRYAVGGADLNFIVFCVVLFTGLRAGVMEYVLAPFAKLCGVQKKKDLTRFSEQAWLLIYYSIFWTMGVYIYATSPYYGLKLKELWTAWPDREMTALIKGYMLAQWAFWVQQLIVINIEERRKDHWQMFTHHIITIALIASCYCFHFHRVGNLVLVAMDLVDLFFPLAKCFKYTGHRTLCDIMFGVFMLSWVYARHFVYILICWSVYKDSMDIIGDRCYRGSNDTIEGPFEVPSTLGPLLEPFYNPSGYVCYGTKVMWSFLGPLLALQVITLAWFTLIIRVAIKVITGAGAEDVRSDDEDDGEDEDEFVYEEATALEQEVGVEEIDLKNWERRTGVKRQASSSGVSLPGHSDRKELLGRIGCEKQVD